MNVVAWILQVLLAFQYLYHGWIFISPPAAMAGAMATMGIHQSFRQFIGVAEILAAAGLVLPALTRIQPGLTPLAALGLMVVMGQRHHIPSWARRDVVRDIFGNPVGAGDADRLPALESGTDPEQGHPMR